MTGKELKEILDDLNVRYNDLAARLGMSQQNFSASLKVNDIKTGYIERIAHAIHVPVIYFYDRAARMGTTISDEQEPEPEPTETQEAPTASNDMQQVLIHLTALVTTQNKKIDELSKQLADLTALVSNQRNTTQYVFADSSPRQVADTTEIK